MDQNFDQSNPISDPQIAADQPVNADQQIQTEQPTQNEQQPSAEQQISVEQQPSAEQQVEQQHELFESLLTQYEHQLPQPGQLLDGTIIRIDKDGILVDIGIKRDALIPAKDYTKVDEAYISSLSTGAQIPIYVIGQAAENGELQLSLSKGLEHQLWEQAEKYMQEGALLELPVLGHNRGGLIIRFETLRGFVPYSLVPDLQGIRSPKRAETIKNGLVGKPLPVKITEVDRNRNRLILSAEAAQKELLQKKLQELKKGQVITGRVVKVTDFGAFVDLDGVDGLIHISQLAWKKPKHPSEVIKVGEQVEVKVIEVNTERQRVGLSRKAMLPSPWQTLQDEIKAGDYIEGIVTRIVDFGAFVKLECGVEGLIHKSQIGYSSPQAAEAAIKPGDKVLLKVLDVDTERKRIALSMRQVPIEKQLAWAMDNLEEAQPPKPEPKPAPEPKPVVEPKAEVEIKAEAEHEPKPEVEIKAEAETKAETEPEPETESASE
jgi:small subunit ribosomal protein S1